MSRWADFKRLLEKCCADPGFREGFLSTPTQTLREQGLCLDADIAVDAVIIHISALLNLKHKTSPDANAYINMLNNGIKSVHRTIAQRISIERFNDSAFKTWYQRQNNKILFGSAVHRRVLKVIYIPVSFELTKGCSGDCPFCCLAPRKLEGCFYYTHKNALLWQSVLLRTKEIIGEAAACGVCYFATEPFDNPDYERFIGDFYKINGYYPQTTTAKAAHDTARIKGFLKMLGDEHLKQAAVRFSVISKEQLNGIHSAFTPSELAYVELLLNNPESIQGYSLAGRALKLQKRLPAKKFIANVTSVCTTGFVVNMPEGAITLTVPRSGDLKGMRVYEKAYFTDEVSYAKAMFGLISKWMKPDVPVDTPLTVDFEYERQGNHLVIYGDKIRRTIGASEDFYQCFMCVSKGETLDDIFRALGFTEYQRLKTLASMRILYDGGYIDIA